MSAKEVDAYSTYGLELNGRPCKIPRGIDVVFYGRGGDTVNATFFVSPINPDPLARKTGEDIDNELANLPVISDNVSNPLVSHPYLKVETDLSNPELDYNNGELDFLRSKPVQIRTAWRPSHEIDQINEQFKQEQILIGEQQERQNFRLVQKDENRAVKNPVTGEKYYPYQMAQVTEGGDKEHDGAKPEEGVGGLDVGPHWQEVSNGNVTTKRWYNDVMHQEEAHLSGRSTRESLKIQSDASKDLFK